MNRQKGSTGISFATGTVHKVGPEHNVMLRHRIVEIPEAFRQHFRHGQSVVLVIVGQGDVDWKSSSDQDETRRCKAEYDQILLVTAT